MFHDWVTHRVLSIPELLHPYPQNRTMAITAFTEENNTPSLLTQKIRDHITTNGSIPFREFMAYALYDAEQGYYAGNQQRVGKGGDFITSVSVGRCFGLILAHRLERYWREIGSPEDFHIIEPGAHDGALCADIIAEIQRSFPDFYRAVTYNLIETTEKLRLAQTARLTDEYAGKFKIHPHLSILSGLTGAMISNELVDAMPVDLIRRQNNHWLLLMVDLDAHGDFCFSPTTIPDEYRELIDFCKNLTDFPEGYTTEFQPKLRSFARESSQALGKGLFITIDYGHHGEDYYHPDRTEGTLQTYHSHQKSDNPLTTPGEIDITAHVDFTRLNTEMEAAGFQHRSLGTQASYLTHQAKNWLIGMEQEPSSETPALLRQFQTLTHPAMLGTRFMVLEMEK